MNCRIFHDFLTRAPESPFERYRDVKANFVFRLFNVFLRFRGQKDKKPCLLFAMFNFSEQLQNIFEIRFEKIWNDQAKLTLEKK